MKSKISTGTIVPIIVGILAITVVAGPALAQKDPTPTQLMEMIQAQQKQLDALKAALMKTQVEAQEAAAEVEKMSESAPGLPKGFQFGGVIEVEATNTETFAEADSSDLALATIETYFDAQPFEYVSTHVQLIYEDDGNENINLDEAFATLGNTDIYPVYLLAGKWAIPFGGFDTALSSDPLTLDLGETKEAAVLVGYTESGFTLEGYGYNGDTQQAGEGDHIDQFGIAAGYAAEINGTAISVGAGYISNVADSDGLTTTLDNNAGALRDYIDGWEMHGSIEHGPLLFYAGYMAAKDSFQLGEIAFNGQGAKPAAWNLEAAYVTDIIGKETILAATVQGTEESLAQGLPETRYGGAVTIQIFDHAAVTAEYLHDEDYGTSSGGTGREGSTATLKLATEF